MYIHVYIYIYTYIIINTSLSIYIYIYIYIYVCFASCEAVSPPLSRSPLSQAPSVRRGIRQGGFARQTSLHAIILLLIASEL